MDALRELIPTRQTLLSRLRDLNNQESWREFFDTYWRLIFNTARKAGLSRTEAEEVVQETVASVSKKMPEFRYDPKKGSFKAWLLRLTQWRIIDEIRKRPPSGARNGVACSVEGIADPSANQLDRLWNEEWEKNSLEVALERTKLKVEPTHYQVFDLCVLQRLDASKVAHLLRIRVTTVRVIKHRVARIVRKQIEKLEHGLY